MSKYLDMEGLKALIGEPENGSESMGYLSNFNGDSLPNYSNGDVNLLKGYNFVCAEKGLTSSMVKDAVERLPYPDEVIIQKAEEYGVPVPEGGPNVDNQGGVKFYIDLFKAWFGDAVPVILSLYTRLDGLDGVYFNGYTVRQSGSDLGCVNMHPDAPKLFCTTNNPFFGIMLSKAQYPKGTLKEIGDTSNTANTKADEAITTANAAAAAAAAASAKADAITSVGTLLPGLYFDRVVPSGGFTAENLLKGTGDAIIDWGDGNNEVVSITTDGVTVTHAYTEGAYTQRVYGCRGMTEIRLCPTTSDATVTAFRRAGTYKADPVFGKDQWNGCTALASVPDEYEVFGAPQGNIFTRCGALRGSLMVYAPEMTTCSWIFWNGNNLTEVGIYAPKCQYQRSMFQNGQMTRITELAVRWSRCSGCFQDCGHLQWLPKMDWAGVVECGSTFSGCTRLPAIWIDNFGQSMSNEYSGGLFDGCNAWQGESVAYTLLDHSYDRAANNKETLNVALPANAYNSLTEEQLAALTAKGYNVTLAS